MKIKLQCFTDLKAFFEAEIEGINVARYKGEFTNHVSWDEVYPIIFIRMDGNKVNYLAGGTQNYSIPITLFVGAQNEGDVQLESLDLIDTVENLIDGKVLVLSAGDVKCVKIKKFDTTLLGYMKGGAEIYEINAELQ